MDVEEFRTKPSWEAYEATLLTRGFMPRFEPGTHPFPSPAVAAAALPSTWCRRHHDPRLRRLSPLRGVDRPAITETAEA